MDRLPVIDMAPLFGADDAARARAAAEIGAACRDLGFFYVSGHGVSEALLARLQGASADFFARPEAEKMRIAMAEGGRAWRGYFPVGGELTSGMPDLKEGLYFGEELGADDPRVSAGWPLHGRNLFPEAPADLRDATLAFIAAATRAARALMEGVAQSLGLAPAYFHDRYTRDPTLLFRIFHYPPARDESWGVGEHTDYGLLTLLAQDDVGGLQVKAPQGWIEAPPIPGTLVCNIGDMLDRLTGGRYRSTPHRVRNASGRERYSFPFFFDPAFDAEIVPLPDHVGYTDAARWDGQDLAALSGSYGDYLIAKVSKVFPELTREIA